jgi:hypothetical protein
MKSFSILIGAIALVLAVGGLMFYLAVDRQTLRYKITYEVDVGGVTHTGSSVVEVAYEDTQGLPLPNTGVGNSVRGEAAVVDLGGGRYLFALMDGASDMPYRAFSQLMGKDDSFLSFARKLAREKPSAALPLEKAPRLVTFADINDPKTVTLVDPGNLAAAFDPDVTLTGINVEITNESVTEERIGAVLGWITAFNDKQFDGKRYRDLQNNSLANALGSGDFVTRGDK